MHPLEKYPLDLRQFRSTGAGVPETSYYSALSGFLDAVGAQLKPKARCIAQLANQGAGSPDYGFFTNDQFQTSKDDAPLPGQLPERGVVEVKPVREDVLSTANGTQVAKYLERYGQVLVSNYREFVLVARNESRTRSIPECSIRCRKTNSPKSLSAVNKIRPACMLRSNTGQ